MMHRASGQNQARVMTREELTANAILNSPRDRPRSARAAVPRQDLLIKEEIQNQMHRLRDAFVRADPRTTGTIPRHLMACTFKAGGMELPPAQLQDAKHKYTNGDGRFNWILCCNDVEKARHGAWHAATRVKAARAFNMLDLDGSGKLGRKELAQAVSKMNVNHDGKSLDELFDSMDEDADGNLDFAEFVDGLATNMVTPNPVWGRVMREGRGPAMPGFLAGQHPLKQGSPRQTSPRNADSPRGRGLMLSGNALRPSKQPVDVRAMAHHNQALVGALRPRPLSARR